MPHVPSKPDGTRTPRTAEGQFRRRISPQIRRAIGRMVWEGLTPADAADRENIKLDTLTKALKRPHVIELLKSEASELAAGATARAFRQQLHLAEHAQSEQVRQKAAAWIAGIGGVAPAQNLRVQSDVHHTFSGIGFTGIAVGPTIDGSTDEQDEGTEDA